MKKIVKFIIFLAWIYAIFAGYSYLLYPIFDICENSPDPKYCASVQNIYYYYYSIYAVIAVGYGGSILYTKNYIKWTIALAMSVIFFIGAQKMAMEDIADIRTYGYQNFIIIFNSWIAFLASAIIASFLFRKIWKKIAVISVIISFVSAYFFVTEGKGGVEQLSVIIGDGYRELNWENIIKSQIFIYGRAFLIWSIALSILHGLFVWIKRGDITKEDDVLAYSKIGAIYVAILLISLISVPFGNDINDFEVKKARSFIDDITPKLHKYYNEKSQYPESLFYVINEDIEVPELIDIYEYKANENKGSYYFARPHKYCFIFMDTGRDFGFYSITSDRDWRYNKYDGISLENSFMSLCDEDSDGGAQGLVASHLGMIKTADPVARMGLDLGDGEVNRPAQTSAASNELESVIRQYAKEEPSLVERTQDRPESVDDLYRMLDHNTKEMYEIFKEDNAKNPFK